MQMKRESPALKHQQQLALYAIAHVREENERERVRVVSGRDPFRGGNTGLYNLVLRTFS